MSTTEPHLDHIDLNTNSRSTLAVLVKLLAPHVPYSLHILGTILNVGPRASALQAVDPSNVTLWSTIPIHSDATSTTNLPTLFSIVTFSHLNHQFRIFCSSESSMSGLPTEAEETHIKHVFEQLLDIARSKRPTYDSTVIALGGSGTSGRFMHRVDTDPPTIIVGCIHTKWARVLASMSTCQSPAVRYVFPPGLLARDELRATLSDSDEEEMEVSEIRATDLPFVHGASSVPRSDAYVLSRVPYSVCLRLREDAKMREDRGRPVACALVHSDGSIGALRVDQEHQRRGLGKLAIRALTEKLDFSKVQGGSEWISDDHQDLGGGALGWNWVDVGLYNEVANRFFTSMVGEENKWSCHWTYMPIDGLL